jgi:hypothetical protein
MLIVAYKLTVGVGGESAKWRWLLHVRLAAGSYARFSCARKAKEERYITLFHAHIRRGVQGELAKFDRLEIMLLKYVIRIV